MPADLKAFISEAVQANPAVKEKAQITTASKEAIRPAGALDNPEVSLGLLNVPVNTWVLNQQDMTMMELAVSQKLPFPGKRRLRSEVAEEQSKADSFSYQDQINEIRAKVIQGYWNLSLAYASYDITQKDKEMWEQVVQVAETRYGVGQGMQADVLQAQVELGNYLDRLFQWQQRQESQRADLNALRSKPSGATIARPKPLKPRPLTLNLDNLLALAAEQPQLQALKAQVTKQEKAVALAKKDFFPDFTVGVGYGYRESSQTVNRSDFFSSRVSLDVPIWRAGKIKPKIREEQARQEAAQHAHQSAWDRVAAAIKDRFVTLQRLSQQIQLYDRGIIPQARQASDASLAAYQAGTLDFSRLTQNYIALYDAELKLQDYLKDFEDTWAELEWLAGQELPPLRSREMSSVARRSLWWGLVLGIGLCALTLAALYFAGFRFMRHEGPAPTATAEGKPLCYVSPSNTDFIRFSPGKDEKGQELVPVYPTQPGVPATGQTVKLWMSPADSTFIQSKPGVDLKGQALVPFEGSLGKPPAPAAGAPAAQGERKIKYWVSPMDPGYIRDKPGKAPCGMDLVPVYESAGEEAPGTIRINPATVQSMGVTTTKVEVRPLSRMTLTVGMVTFDERNLNVITTKMDGWVERLYVRATGDPIHRGQNLLSIYSPELVTTQNEYLLALKNLKSLEKSGFPELEEGARRLLAAARQRLKYWDIPDSQIAALEETGEVKKTLTLVSPVNGIVTKREVTQGMMVKAGMPVLEVADLSTVWVDADIYQYELPWIKVGQPVSMTLDYLPGETFQGRIDYIYPYLKEATRTARVRLRFSNPRLKLKPDMFAQVKIQSPVTHSAVVVPSDAVLDTGLKQHVFIALGQGRFEPREVKLGVLGNDGMREVLSGLKGGEEVVTSAQFMLDSESRFREAVQMMMPSVESGSPKEETPAAMPGMKMGETPPATPAMPAEHKH